MRIDIPEFADKKGLFDYLVTNKSKLIAQKKSLPITVDAPFSSVSFSKNSTPKAASATENDNDTLRVKIVCNTANWCDSQFDVILPNAASRSINNRKDLIVHLKDHNYQISSEIGDVVDVYNETVSLRDLGLELDGSTQCLIMISDVKRAYDERSFMKYKAGKANQHSIGLQYIKLELAINDEDYQKEFENWNKYYDQVINKEVINESGFFWAVHEYKLLENSLVLFGANELTPTLDNDLDSAKSHSKKNSDPSTDTRKLDAINAILTKLN